MTHKKSLVELEQTGQYGAVVISNCGCDISSQLSAQFFSFEHAPSLPLTGCTADKCTCEYKGIADRRLKFRPDNDSSDYLKSHDERRKTEKRKESI